jgi:hypothetical protein
MHEFLLKSIASESLAPALPEDIGGQLAQTVIGPLAEVMVYPRSISVVNRNLYFLGQRDGKKYVGVISGKMPQNHALKTSRTIQINHVDLQLALIPADNEAAEMLKAALPFLSPRVIGPIPSGGCGDRLGLATPGHVRALAKTQLGAVLCQQSVRENSRTGRSPRQVLDDAMWGAWQEGWRRGFGADADHLKTESQIDIFVEAGYTFYTVDVGDPLDSEADSADTAAVEAKVTALPWDRLQSTASDLINRLTRRPVELDGVKVDLTRADILRAAAKYGAAVAQAYEMYQHLYQAMGQGVFEFEVSVDETETATTLAEHIYIASELARLGVVCTSLAPRFVGAFEKGVDYIGDIVAFEASFERHAAVARAYGNYKLSLHSGSDKFAIYPVAARHSKGAIHLKTAGTSYLEALRTVAEHVPELFRDIFGFCITRYADDRQTYHVSAEIDRLPAVPQLPDVDLPAVLNDFHAREVLHVTYGSVLNNPPLCQGLFDVLHQYEDAYGENLERHFDRHFALLV